MDYELSVIMPALNEESNITDAVNQTFGAFNHFKINGEIIVINDGSKDKTGSIVQEMVKSNNKLRIINHESPMGIGFSFWDGIGHAKGEVVMMVPGDNENDVYETLQYFDLMKLVDLIVPYIINVRNRTLSRRILSSIYRFIINFSFGINLNYTNGTVLYRKAIFEGITLKAKGFFYQAELLINTIRKGYLFAEVPCGLGKRNVGKSKAISLKSFINVMKGYIKTFIGIHIFRNIGRGGNLSPNTVSYKRHEKINKAYNLKSG